MKDIEKKLISAVQNTGNVSPLLLDNIKERVAAEPLEAEKIKAAKVKRGVKFSFNFIMSACATFVVCMFCFYAVLIFFMPADAMPPNMDGGDSDAKNPSLSDYKQTAIDEPFDDYCERNGLSLLKISGDCEFYLLTARGEPDVYKSIYAIDNKKVTIIQSTDQVFLSDIEDAIHNSTLRLYYDCRLAEELTLNFAIYENDSQFLSLAYHDDGRVVFVTIDYPVGVDDGVGSGGKDIDDIRSVLDDIRKNYDH